MQNHSGGVDNRAQRVTQGLAQLLLNRIRQAGEGKVERTVVQQLAGNFLAKRARTTRAASTTGSWPSRRQLEMGGCAPHHPRKAACERVRMTLRFSRNDYPTGETSAHL